SPRGARRTSRCRYPAAAPTIASASSRSRRTPWTLPDPAGLHLTLSRSGAATEEVPVLAVHDQLLRLVVDGGAHHHDTGGAPRPELGDRQQRIDGVSHVDGLEEGGRLPEEGAQALPAQ